MIRSVLSSSRSISSALNFSRNISNVVVVGAGIMGSGIVQVTASNGFNVTMVDAQQKAVDGGLNTISKSISRVLKKAKDKDPATDVEGVKADILSRISSSTDVAAAVSNADLVIEAITENLEVKHKVWSAIDNAAPASCIFASNTSSLRIGDIAACTGREDKFAGAHFFNPVPMLRLVEIIQAPKTSADTIATLTQFAKDIKKTPVPCKDTPGFIVNRLLVPYMMESIRMVERGDAQPKDVDTAMKLGAGYPMGPFELGDVVGLDTMKFIIDGWAADFPEEPLFKPSPLLNELVAAGKLGRKTGEGFYNYKE